MRPIAILFHGVDLRTVTVSDDSVQVITTEPLVEASVAFDGLGGSILFMTEAGALD